MPSQESVVASLHELRAIEQQRVADEAALRAAEHAAREAARLAAAARVEAAARAVRDEALADAARRDHEAETARRADELVVACAEAEARARAHAEVDAARMAQEIEVQRERVARTRPVALIAVICALVLGGGGLAVLLVEQRSDLAAREAAIRDVTSRADKLHQDTEDLIATAHDLQIEVDKREAELAKKTAAIAQLQAAAKAGGVPPPVVHAVPASAPSPPVRPPVVIDAHCAGSVLCK